MVIPKSSDSNMRMFDCGLSWNVLPFIKMRVPPPKDAYGIPVGTSELKMVPSRSLGSYSLYPRPSKTPRVAPPALMAGISKEAKIMVKRLKL